MEKKKSRKRHNLYVYNDNKHSFSDVTNIIMSVCNLSIYAANQCTLLIHHKGKVCVKVGTMYQLEEIQKKLKKLKLKTEII